MTDSAGGRLRAARPFSFSTFLRLAVPLAAALLAAPAQAQDSASLASKSIAQVYTVQNRVFVLAEDGRAFSRLDLFASPPQVVTAEWPWRGGAEAGAAWSNSLLLRANYWISDSQRVAYATSLRFGGSFRGGDSLIFPDPLESAGVSPLADGARFTALAVRDTVGGQPATAVLGFGRLGIAYATLAPESSLALFTPEDTVLSFQAFPTASDSLLELYACRWNRLCRVDTLTVPEGGLDSVTALAIDSSHADSIWVLVATQKGLRRGLWGSNHFPYVTLPDLEPDGAPVRSVFASPGRALLWVFTGSRYFFSDDHGANFRVPDSVDGIQIKPSSLSGYSPDRPPHAAFHGDTTYINFNFDTPGLVAFHRDTILANEGEGLGQVLLGPEDGLEIASGEGALTALTVARGLNPAQAVLVTGSTLKGVFFRRLDRDEDFTNINRLRSLKGSLGEVITYPTLLTESRACGDAHVRIGYRVKKDARVTITVYNYAMEKVRVVVKNAPRRGGVARSENIADDRWDGCDDRGRFVSVGTYYILVESDKGEKAFGKAIVTRGRK